MKVSDDAKVTFLSHALRVEPDNTTIFSYMWSRETTRKPCQLPPGILRRCLLWSTAATGRICRLSPTGKACCKSYFTGATEILHGNNGRKEALFLRFVVATLVLQRQGKALRRRTTVYAAVSAACRRHKDLLANESALYLLSWPIIKRSSETAQLAVDRCTGKCRSLNLRPRPWLDLIAGL